MQRQPNPSPHPLTSAEVEASRREHGSNTLSVKRRKSFIRQFLSNLGDPVIRILLGALTLNLIFSFKGGDPFETAGIGLAVFLATLISTLSEYGSESAFARLSEACSGAICRVRRRQGCDGKADDMVREISLGEAVVGDIAVLSPGEMIPADGFLLSGCLSVDQSAMTGESREVEKIPLLREMSLPEHPSPADASALFRGCVILSGGGEMLITRVGDSTFLGEISGEVQEDTRESPLKVRLTKLARQISRLGYIAAALVAVVSLLGAFVFNGGEVNRLLILARLSDWRYVWESLFHALTLGLTVLVVAVPEGLPMMIAVVLSSNIQKMVKDEVLVRKPVGIEAAGSMNILFTDKTGTLTEGRLSVGEIMSGDGTRYKHPQDVARRAPLLYHHFVRTATVNTLSVMGMGDGAQEDTPRALGGNATDRALLDAVLKVNGEIATAADIEWKIPFDSARKFSSSAERRDGQCILYIKGSPERLLPRIVNAYRSDGTCGALDKNAVSRQIREWTTKGERVLLVAEQVGGVLPSRSLVESGQLSLLKLTLVCILTLSDRLRPEAPEAVATLRRAGIHVVMMTGDNRDTARAIAEDCGILGQGVDTVLDSDELSRMSDARLSDILPRVGVIARALPTDKSRLVRLSQESDLVVGMTGDGINDAPALKRADIGFAMGEGTQVAKDAGDIIIMDNNLGSIAKAVLYGRTIFKSIRKFITLQLTMNFCAVGVTMIAPFLGIESPVTVVQMLWINLIMDTLGGLAYAGEAPLPSYMEEKPKRRDEPILNRYMVGEIAWLGSFTVALCLLFLKHPVIVSLYRPAENNIYLLTAFFALFIFASVFNCFNTRTDRLKLLAGLGKNRAFLLIMAAVLVIQILFVYLGGSVLRTAPLTASELAVTSLLALSVIPAGLLRKGLRRLCGKQTGY